MHFRLPRKLLKASYVRLTCVRDGRRDAVVHSAGEITNTSETGNREHRMRSRLYCKTGLHFLTPLIAYKGNDYT
jgi:hypothetical protein